ncbi:MAG: helix-turn-helix transcriptional regulator [Treponema sp.]|nr:helix-turn-helix transcriptional regulator [Treponema sp.]
MKREYDMDSINSENLTSREQEILNLLLEGVSSKDIAFKLNISPRTVDYHRSNIYNKLNVHNYQELLTKYSSIKNKKTELESPAKTEFAQTGFAHSYPSKINKLYKFLIPATVFILIISIIPLWYFTIKAYFSKSHGETQAAHVFIDHTYDTLYLRANRYSNDDLYGQCYSTLLQDIKFRHFYSGTLDDLLPIPYDWYTVRISGIAEMELENVKLNLALLPYGEGDWIYLGGGDNRYVSIGPGYFSAETDIKKIFVNVSELPPGEIVFILVADLFQVHNKNPEYSFDSGLRIPDNVPDRTIITAVRNFKIEPVLTP